MSKQIKVKDCFWEEEYYPRNGLNTLNIIRYDGALQTGAIFPPIGVVPHKGKYLILDGVHRWTVYKKRNIDKIPADILDLKDKKEWKVYAITSNLAHGGNLNVQERVKAIITLEDLGYKQTQISEILQIPVNQIDKFKVDRIISTPVGREVLKTPFKHLARGKFSALPNDLIEQQKKIQSSTQLDLFNSVIYILQNDLIDRENPKVIEALMMIRKLTNIKNLIP